jgi:D-arabinono-1,4-lactone oxidase
MLSYMNNVHIDKDTKTVEVDGGCHLGYDPFDPTKLSSFDNSLFHKLDNAGFAVPDMGGIIHQTVAGFLSTGSSGGSTIYSFSESLVSLTFVPANTDNPEPVTVSINDANTDLFYAAGVSMGLFGIIVSAKFSLVPKYNINGNESIYSIANAPLDMTGKGVAGKQSLQNFLTTTPYSRLLWYPQPGVSRVTVWQAAPMPPNAPFKRSPYNELDPILGSRDLAQVGADLVYSAFGQYPAWLGNLLGTNTPAYKAITSYVDNNFYSTIFPDILPMFVKEGASQNFQDYWWSSLPMDNNISDQLFPVEFTELWIPFNQNDGSDTINKVLLALNDLFTEFYANKPSVAAGDFCTELYAAKQSKFWMSPSYGTDVFRVDVFWFGHNVGSPVDYYQLFWDKLAPFNYRCHWGKYMPAADSPQGSKYLLSQYEKAAAFLEFRKQMDPDNVFLTDYWKKHLGII